MPRVQGKIGEDRMKITDIFHNMQALYEMQEQLARIGAQMCRITEDLVDNDGSIENAVEYVSNARISLTEFLEKLEGAEVEIEF